MSARTIIRLCACIIAFLQLHAGDVQIAGFQVSPDFIQDALKGIEEFNKEFTLNIDWQMSGERKNIQKAEEDLRALAARYERGQIGKVAFETEEKLIRQRIARAEAKLADIEKARQEIATAAVDLTKAAVSTVLEIDKQERAARNERYTAVAAAAAQQDLANKGALERLQYLTQPEVAKVVVTYGTLAALGASAAYYAAKVTARYVEHKIDKIPDLARETSRVSLLDRAKNRLRAWWEGEQPPAQLNECFIFSPDTAQQLEPIATRTGLARERGLPFTGALLLHGEPGTGKTAFARWLAQTSGMDYVIMSGSEIINHPNNVMALREAVLFAANNPKGTIVFIDEVDAIGFDRARNQDRKVVIILEELLVLMSDPQVQASCKFIIATNKPHDLDPALISRSEDKIYVGLPGQVEREKMLKLFLNKYVIGSKHLVKDQGKSMEVILSCASDVTDQVIAALAQKTAGLAGRTLEQIARKWQTEALFGTYVLDAATMHAVVDKVLKEQSQLALTR